MLDLFAVSPIMVISITNAPDVIPTIVLIVSSILHPLFEDNYFMFIRFHRHAREPFDLLTMVLPFAF